MQTFASIRRCVAVALAIASLAATPSAYSQDPSEIIRATRNTSIAVPVYKSRIVEVPAAVKRVSIGNPDIADVLILRSNELYVLGKDLGTTNVMLWDRDDVLVSALSVSITHDLDGLQRQLSSVLGGEKVQASSAHRNIVLSGQVTSAVKMDAALQIAKGYLEQAATAKDKLMFEQESSSAGAKEKKAGEVINLMTVGGAQQVMLQVKVAEVRRDALRKLNVQHSVVNNSGEWVIGGVNGGASFPDAIFQPGNVRVPIFGDGTPAGGNPIGPVFDEFAPNTPTIGGAGLFASFLSNEFLANVVLDAARDRGLAKILAEPTLTTLTGQEAQFLSGGSFPIPVSQDNGRIGIEFKDFGVKLLFQPLILADNRINLKLNISVSELVDTNSLVIAPIGSSGVFAIPSLSERRALSTVELSDGQSIGIAGLMNENMRSAVTKFPGLGDLPILGALFRSQNFRKGQTELVILVTPKLAKPMRPNEIKLPTDNIADPSDAEFYFFGKIEGSAKTAQSTATPSAATQSTPPPAKAAKTGGSEGTYGHVAP
jgi:pilus assembly protein CpaC